MCSSLPADSILHQPRSAGEAPHLLILILIRHFLVNITSCCLSAPSVPDLSNPAVGFTASLPNAADSRGRGRRDREQAAEGRGCGWPISGRLLLVIMFTGSSGFIVHPTTFWSDLGSKWGYLLVGQSGRLVLFVLIT